MRKLRVSVTDLAQLICRTGDLELGGVAGPSARDGQKAHQRWQAKTQSSNEVSVKSSIEIDGVGVTLGGRIDILDRPTQHITEIKSTLVPAEHVSESQKALHRAQVRLYAFALMNEVNADDQADLLRDSWTLDVLYVNLRDESPTRETEQLTQAEITTFGMDILRRYVQWMRRVEDRREACQSSSQALEFPFPAFRAGQRQLASVIFRGARDGFSSLCEAPTGIGKTISALFPAMKAIGEKEAGQVVYLTAKASGVNAVSDALTRMTDNGLNVNSVSLRSKQLTCFCSNGGCERDDDGRCPMTIGFFDRLPIARDELLSVGVITPAIMDKVAWEHKLCPFELALQMLPWMNVAVCDYNYVFDPLVRLPWFSEARRSSLVLIDEAHNLPDRSRSMFSGHLNRTMGADLARALAGAHGALLPRIAAVDRALLKHARGLPAGESVTRESPDGMRESVSQAIESLLEAMATGPALPQEGTDWFKALCRYAAIDDLYGEAHRTITEISKWRGKKDVRISLRCLDASKELNRLYKFYGSVCFFSATLRPDTFYQTTLGTPEGTKSLQLQSPFDPSQSEYLVVPTIGTRYRQRDESLNRLVELVRDVCDAKPGSYLVFLPSFAYLEKLWEAYVAKYPDQQVWKQAQGQSREERQELLTELETSGARLGFVIMGGVFGEGVDYVGDRLIGAIVVGVGLPGLSAEQELMEQHYRESGYDGYDFANRIPGFIRVLQTVGRVIRTESDRGVVVLVDDRFQSPFYRSNFPEHIQLVSCPDRQSWNRRLSAFWDTTEVVS